MQVGRAKSQTQGGKHKNLGVHEVTPRFCFSIRSVLRPDAIRLLIEFDQCL